MQFNKIELSQKLYNCVSTLALKFKIYFNWVRAVSKIKSKKNKAKAAKTQQNYQPVWFVSKNKIRIVYESSGVVPGDVETRSLNGDKWAAMLPPAEVSTDCLFSLGNHSLAPLDLMLNSQTVVLRIVYMFFAHYVITIFVLFRR